MALQRNTSGKLSKLSFDSDEAKGIIVSVLALSLALTAGQWGDKVFSAAEGMKNLAIAIPIVALSLVAHETAHKLAAQSQGTHVRYQPHWLAVAFSAVIGIVSGGWIIITSVGTWVPISLKRIGFKHPFIGMPAQAKIAFSGLFVSLILVIAAKSLIGIFGEIRALQDLFIFNLWMTFFNLLPFNPAVLAATHKLDKLAQGLAGSTSLFDGAYLFGGNPLLYVGFVGFAVATVLGLIFLPPWASFILGGIAGLAAWAFMHKDTLVNVLPR